MQDELSAVLVLFELCGFLLRVCSFAPSGLAAAKQSAEELIADKNCYGADGPLGPSLRWCTPDSLRLRSGQALAPLVKTRGFGMTPP